MEGPPGQTRVRQTGTRLTEEKKHRKTWVQILRKEQKVSIKITSLVLYKKEEFVFNSKRNYN